MGAGTIGVGLLGGTRTAEASHGLTPGDAALLRFPAALELLEADFWIQYNELGGIQDAEVPGGLATQTTPRPSRCWRRHGISLHPRQHR